MLNSNVDVLSLNFIEIDAIALLSISKLILDLKAIKNVEWLLSPVLFELGCRINLVLVLKDRQWIQLILIKEVEAVSPVGQVKLSEF